MLKLTKGETYNVTISKAATKAQQQTNLIEAHMVFLSVALRLSLVDLSLEGQVESVTHQDLQILPV